MLQVNHLTWNMLEEQKGNKFSGFTDTPEDLLLSMSSVGMEGSDLGNARAGEVAAFATNPSSVSFVLYCVIVFIWFFCFTFFL